MDEIKFNRDSVYQFIETMQDHSITPNQMLYLLANYYSIEYDQISASDIVSLYNKGLLKSKNTNITKLFHLKKSEQLSLDIMPDLQPKGIEYTLAIADKIEKEFVIDKYLDISERKRVADKYFKGDSTVARYFIIFKSLFPVRSKKNNSKWNKKFGFIYDGIDLWDDSQRVSKKFLDVYKTLDIGIFLEATYRKVKNSIDFNQQRCFMTKPYKFLTAYDSIYQETVGLVTKRMKGRVSDEKLNIQIDRLKV